jgi:hypothetical protein
MASYLDIQFPNTLYTKLCARFDAFHDQFRHALSGIWHMVIENMHWVAKLPWDYLLESGAGGVPRTNFSEAVFHASKYIFV